MVANMQMTAYYNYLNKNNIRLEDIVEWFFKEYLKKELYGHTALTVLKQWH